MTGYAVGPVLRPGERPWPLQWESSVLVRVCNHPVWESVLLPPNGGGLMDEVVRCARCHAPRCGSTRSDDPCMKVRHHKTHHMYVSGRIEPLGGHKCALAGCACLAVAKASKEVAK